MNRPQTLKKLSLLLRSEDKQHIDQGVELARSLADPALIRELLKGTRVLKRGYQYKSDGVPEVVLPPALKPRGGGDARGALYALIRLIAAFDLPCTRALREKLVGVRWRWSHYPIDLTALPALESLIVSYPNVPNDLAPVAGLKRLKRLSLEGNIGPAALISSPSVEWLLLGSVPDSPLKVGALPSLKTLRLTDLAGLTDLSVVAASTQLTELTVENCDGFTSLAGVEGMRGLSTLHVEYGKYSSLEPLRGLPALRELGVSGTPIEDLSVVATLPALESLDISSTHVRSLEALRDHPSLKTVEFYNCERLESLAGLPPRVSRPRADDDSLGTLSWGSLPALRSLDGMEGFLPNLDEFSCYAMESLTSIEALGGAPRLKSLTLSNLVALPSLKGLESCRKLEWLALDDAATLTDLSALAGLPRLAYLSLRGATALTDLTPLASLPSLQVLDLRSALSLTDLTPLAGLSKLKTVALRGSAVPRRAIPKALARAVSFARTPPHKRMEVT